MHSTGHLGTGIHISDNRSDKRGAFDGSMQHHLIDLRFKDGVAMSQQRRSRFSPTQITDVWRRWKAGQSLHDIGRAYGKPHPSIRCVLLPGGGIAPAARRRSRLALALGEREDISRGIASGLSIREMAGRLGRAASTVSREITRHGGRAAYRAHDADRQAWVSALRPKRCLLALNRKLRDIVASKLILDWSPEQISGWLKIQHPDDESLRVSHETIYRSLFIQARGVLKKELMDHLRSKRRMRRSRHASASGQSRGQIVDAVSIRERPAEVEDRAIPGHWEGDLLSGAKNSYIATLVERHSRFAMLIKVSSKDTEVVVAALSRHVRKLPATLRRSLTWDRGLEMAKHKDFTVATDVKVYFCDPQSPWQRGTNENTNLLLRQYFPRGTDLSAYSQAQLDQVSLRLNQRPRKTLGFEAPARKLQASVASTT
jgi:IS30 family transposase